MCPIQWDGVPPSERSLPLVVVRPTASEPMTVRLLGPWIQVWLHWCHPEKGLPNGRSRPCMGEDCEFDHEAHPPFWFGYAPAQRFYQGSPSPAPHHPNGLFGRLGEAHRNGQEREKPIQKVMWWGNVICPITEAMALQVLKTDDPRGLVLQLSRVPGKRVLNAQLLERCPTADLPDPFDVRPILLRMWRMRGLKGGA